MEDKLFNKLVESMEMINREIGVDMSNPYSWLSDKLTDEQKAKVKALVENYEKMIDEGRVIVKDNDELYKVFTEDKEDDGSRDS